MILTDREIKDRVQKQGILEFHDPARIKYCGYELTLGKVISPKTGRLHWVEDQPKRSLRNLLTATNCYVIEPSEMLIIVTKESLKMPADLCATYGQLNRLANHGLMILNTSIVEPGYHGPLSCVFVNFSSQRQVLAAGESIAKLNFQTLSGTPDNVFKDSYDHVAYERLASKNATSLPKSLLDIAGVEERVTEKVGAAIKKSVAFGGIVILFLLLWAQLEGFLSHWIYDHTGIMTTTKQVELELKAVQDKDEEEMRDLKRMIADMQNQVKQLKPTVGDGRGAKK
jgi:deoxycytidine triphosphate deaminase